MKKIIVLILFLGLFNPVHSDEGMWLPILINRLNYADMQKMGLKLTAEEIYSVNNASLKDAIAIFGRGCTGEMISAEGLLLTNHHCGYGIIQSHSTTEADYLKEGFWAMNRKEEIPSPTLSVQFLISMEDVTDRVLSAIEGIEDERQRQEKVSGITSEIEADAVKDTHYEGVVRPFFAGNEYYLFVYEKFTDVRFVGAPPSSIGKFGGDTDNWMWPRHTGDFALFRVYTGPDGKPAPYAEENIPYKPRHFLPISIADIKEGDFSMIMGYPGRTERYLTSFGIELNLNSTYPTRIDIRREKMDVMMESMEADPAVRIQYASKYARVANYWKNFIGMSQALKKLQVTKRKIELEERLLKWIDKDEKRQKKYGNVLNEIEKAYNDIQIYNVARFYDIEAIRTGSELLNIAGAFIRYVDLLKNTEDVDQDRIERIVASYESYLKNNFKDLHLPTDERMLAEMLKMYYKNVPLDQQPEMIVRLGNRNNGDFSGFVSRTFRRTLFTDIDDILDAVKKQRPRRFERDPLFQLAKEFAETRQELNNNIEEINLSLNKNNRLFIAALMEMDSDNIFYPDANFTMRLTYGTVKGYEPADAVEYLYFTTMDGILEKKDPDNWEFVVCDKLKELYHNNDFGAYARPDGRMSVNFLTDHDITGGNSGSPVINAYGELIGLAFDGNWEAMSGDIHFESDLQRTINVDMRYVLFIIEKYGEANHLLNEMKIVKKRPERAFKLDVEPEDRLFKSEPVEKEDLVPPR